MPKAKLAEIRKIRFKMAPPQAILSMQALKAQWQGRLTLSVRDFHFRIGAWFCCSNCRNDPIDVQADDRPSRIAEDHDCNDPVSQILLVADVLVGCQENIKGCFLRDSQQLAVAPPARAWRAGVDIAILDSYHQAMKVSVADAKNKLPELIKAVEDGETVTIYRRGVPVVDIIRTKKPSRKKRKLGTLKGKIQILDIDWWKPMSNDEADAFVEGRD